MHNLYNELTILARIESIGIPRASSLDMVNATLVIHSCAVKVDLSKSIKLASTQKQGYTLDQIARFAELSAYLKSGKKGGG